MGKSKSLYGYQIGATIETQERGADVNIVPDNKTLIALPLNDEPDIEADPTRLKNMKEVFTHYQPKVEVDLKNLEGEADMKELKFSALRDFNKDGIIQTTDFDRWYLNPAVLYQYIGVDANLDGISQLSDRDVWYNNRSKLGVADVRL